MALLYPLFGDDKMWAVGVLGAMAHNIGQMCAAVLLLSTPGVAVYLPVLLLSGMVAGLFTGLAAQYAAIHIKKSGGKPF
jgi:heptaprenyl diphosphate synthase